MASVYERDDDNRQPDAAFEPGSVHRLVPGNAGRLLDGRRTPITVIEVRLETGMFVLRLDAFEDKGALWEVPFEDVCNYQFDPTGELAAKDDVARMRQAIERFQRALVIRAQAQDRGATINRMAEAREKAAAWLQAHSSFMSSGEALPAPETRIGSPMLWADAERYFRELDLWDVEAAVAEQYVRNPHSGEIIKGHAIVLAELGLASYEGWIVRDPQSFAGAWTKERRAQHVIARVGFLQALFAALGMTKLDVYRGVSTERDIEFRRRRSFVSTTRDLAVARSHSDAYGPDAKRQLLRWPVPVNRVFMTYLETEAMNQHYKEAEVVLMDLDEPM